MNPTTDPIAPVVVIPKPIYQSKVFWWSIAKGLAALLAVVLASNPTLQTVGWIAFVSQGINIFLRFTTAVPIQ